MQKETLSLLHAAEGRGGVDEGRRESRVSLRRGRRLAPSSTWLARPAGGIRPSGENASSASVRCLAGARGALGGQGESWSVFKL